MKRILILGVALAMVTLMAAGLSAADRKGMIGVGVGGGLLLPMGDFGDFTKLGWRAGTGVGYFVTNEIMIGATGAYSQNKGDENVGVIYTTGTAIDTATGDSITWKIIQYGAFGKYMFKMQNNKIAPYVSAGVALYSQKLSIEGAGSSDTETDFGINGGVGVGFEVSPTTSIFVEGAFHNIFTEGSSTNYITATAGVAFMFGGSSAGGGGTE